MLALAIKARIPIIRASTTDILNLPDVLEAIAPGMQVTPFSGTSLPAKGNLLYTQDEFKPTRITYEVLADAGRVMLLINQDASPFAFEAGEVPVPKELMEDLLKSAHPKGKVEDLLPCFNGLTLKQMADVVRITQARDGTLARAGIVETRALITGNLQGLGQVDTATPLYLCPLTLEKWLAKNKRYFLEGANERLVPRGVLFNGIPGVGKSAGAKYIAHYFGVPLYRLDLGASLSKWQGEAEHNLSRILSALDQEEPCVLLVDEVEKLFAETEDQGVTARLLSQLLWWLAEHRSRVLTVMTSNNLDALPKELYRAGRIDTVVTLEPLSAGYAIELAEMTLMDFLKPGKPTKAQFAAIREAFKGKKDIPHAVAIQTVTDLIKEHKWI